MRLIDADEFRRHIDSHYPFNKAEQSRHGIADVAKSSLLLVLSKEPTVEAIPIEWINKWMGRQDSWTRDGVITLMRDWNEGKKNE